ncbi:MFM1 [Mytilus edulis]|uniref:MRS2 n=1 Tax=Mytilus edulis TaxID=6550 RepID=A0A8S3SSY0_MYTED|nr:MFM1 [Mytilus edulis]
MFVMTEEDIKDIAENQYECFGIVIPDDILQQYIEQWFRHLNKTNLLKKFLNKSRLLMNVTFRSTVRTYMKQLNNENIAYLIKAANSDFLNIIFVMREDEIKDNAENRYELLVQYLCRWIDLTLSITYSVREYIDDNRSFMNLTFNSCIRILMRAQFTEYYQYYIQLTNMDILNSMFVMKEKTS